MPTTITTGAASAKGYGFGASQSAPVYVEDVFSTYIYTGTAGTQQTITNGIDLSTKGGAVFIKVRDGVYATTVYDTARGTGWYLNTTTTGASQSTGGSTYGLNQFNTDGFRLGANNVSSENYGSDASWTFRKQPKFFDIVTYTGTGSARTISHNLGSVPGCIIVKRTDTTGNWQVYHRSLTSAAYSIKLNLTDAEASAPTVWNSTAPTSSVFSVGTDATVNANGGTYVAYLFAHDAGGFGLSGTDSVISCGTYSGSTHVDLGWEPQWIMVREKGGTSPYQANWSIFDTYRGITDSNSSFLFANTTDSELTYNCIKVTATGFQAQGPANFLQQNGMIYIAIRRGPMKKPTNATKVFNPTNTSAASGTIITTGVTSDLFVIKYLDGSDPPRWHDRSRGYAKAVGDASPLLFTSTTGPESNATGAIAAVTNTGFTVTGTLGGLNAIYYSIARAPSFFDIVCYTGTLTARSVNHNLGVVPELIIVKNRTTNGYSYAVFSSATGATKYLYLNTTDAAAVSSSFWNDTSPTSTQFTTGTIGDVNENGSNHVAWLFATCPGVSKVGSYTGTGTTNLIDCGFSSGARFVMIKRTNSVGGDWYVWDSARGIVSGNDPYFLMDSAVSQTTTTSYINPYSAGFEISSTAPAAINASGGAFLYLAIA